MLHALRSEIRFGLASLLCLSLVACQTGGGFAPGLRSTTLRAAAAGAHVDGEGDILRQGPAEFTKARKQGLSMNAQGAVVLAAGQRQGELTSPALKAPYEFDALMPAWNGTGVQIELRTGPDGQTWGAWLPLLPERTMMLPKRAGWVQYRVLLQGAAPQLSGLSLAFGRSRMLRNPGPRHANPFTKPEIVSREGWKAAPPKGEYTPHAPIGIVIHHTWMPRQAQYQQGASIRGIQRYHMEDNKWMDIGYHFLIGPEGVIYQGRPETVIGAHSVPNTGMIGICVFGDYDPDQDPFTDASREALLNLMTWLTAEYGIQTTEFYGHRDFSTKSCPGEEIYKHLQEFKDEVTRRLQDAGVIPPSP